MSDFTRPKDMSKEELENMVNPLGPEDFEMLEDVDAVADVAEQLMVKAELAGIDITAERNELRKLRQQAKGLVAAFGGGPVPLDSV